MGVDVGARTGAGAVIGVFVGASEPQAARALVSSNAANSRISLIFHTSR
jgi:hypothetical protein